MLIDLIEQMNALRGSYPEKVKARMKEMRSHINQSDDPRDPYAAYDYDSYCLRKRADNTISAIAEAKKRLSDILTVPQTEALFAFANGLILRGGYNADVDRIHTTTLAAAIWILDELTLSEKLEESYPYLCPYLPTYEAEADNVLFPIVNHPVYEFELIYALVNLITHRNTARPLGSNGYGSLVWNQKKPDPDEQTQKNRAAFDAILALLDTTAIQAAARRYEEKVWEFYRLSFAVVASVDKKTRELTRLRDELQDRINGSIAEAIKHKNVLRTPDGGADPVRGMALLGQQHDPVQKEMRRLDGEIDRLNHAMLTELSMPNDREKTARRLKGIISEKLTEDIIAFHVDDPFETAFALLYLLDSGHSVPWLYYGSMSVAYTMRDQLPYDSQMAPEWSKQVRTSEWIYRHRYKGLHFEDCTDASGEPVMREYGKNLSQILYSNTAALLPRVVPDMLDTRSYLEQFDELSESEKDAYTLLSHALCAGALCPNSIMEYRAEQNIKQLLEEQPPEDESHNDADASQLIAENKRLREKNRDLITRMEGHRDSRGKDAREIHSLRHRLELQDRELADLRDALFFAENKDTIESAPAAPIQYPYQTDKRILSFGGHETWRKEMHRKLPNVVFVPPDSQPNVDLIRNADAVWLQTNCLSHADFYKIIDIVRKSGKQLRYFSSAGAGRCAEQLVTSLE